MGWTTPNQTPLGRWYPVSLDHCSSSQRRVEVSHYIPGTAYDATIPPYPDDSHDGRPAAPITRSRRTRRAPAGVGPARASRKPAGAVRRVCRLRREIGRGRTGARRRRDSQKTQDERAKRARPATTAPRVPNHYRRKPCSFRGCAPSPRATTMNPTSQESIYNNEQQSKFAIDSTALAAMLSFQGGSEHERRASQGMDQGSPRL